MKTMLLVLLVVSSALSAAESPTFTAKPTAKRVGEMVKISFSVSSPTDVAVYIEDAKGKVIRHLAGGVLGQNPPPPFKAGLNQEMDWDGLADYGKPSEGGPFQVRVALGLRPTLDKVLSRRATSFAGAVALGTGPDGTLYVRHSHIPALFSHSQLVAFNRDGSYRRMLVPFAAMPDNKAAKGFSVIDIHGSQVPVLESEKDLFPDFNGGLFQPCNLAVSRDGKFIYAASSSGIMAFNAEGGCADPMVVSLEKGKIGANPTITTASSLSVSSNGKHLFISGISDKSGKPGLNAIYRLGIPERSGLELFFGDPLTPGNDREHLGASPGGITSDGRGSLLVADTANNRVLVIGEEDGKYRGEFKVDHPETIGAAPTKGVVYIFSRKTGGNVARFALPAPPASTGAIDWQGVKPAGNIALKFGRNDNTRSMAVDTSADPTVIYATAGFYGELFRIVDRDGTFEATPVPVPEAGKPRTEEAYLGVVVDRKSKEVYVRNGNFGGTWERFDDESGKSELLDGFPKGGGGLGPQVVPAPNGNLYGLQWPYSFFQWDRGGKPLPFSEPRKPTDLEMKLNFPTRYSKMKNDIANWENKPTSFVPVAMGELPHTLGVRWSDGHLFVIEPYLYSLDRVTSMESCGGRIMKSLHEYLPSGKRVTSPENPILWKLTDAAVGPKFDAAGNIYVADIVRPRGWAFPPELSLGQPAAGQVLEGKAALFAGFYGSIIKFSPKGGTIHYGSGKTYMGTAKPEPFEGEPKLAAGLKELDVDLFYRSLSPVKITGAEWVHPGVGHIGLWRCNCENITFDVDEFGRTFFADFCLFQIRVIDTTGNSIVNFGGYGNADNCGPDSAVIDPKTGVVRARRADDPKDLVSPFAKPEIAMAWPTGLGVTDKHAYIGDTVNRRLLRCNLTYATEESCEVK